MNWPKLRYHWAHAQAIHTQARYVDLIAGRRSGKTEIAERSLVMQMPKVYPHGMKGLYGFAGPTYQQTKRVAWQKFKELIPNEWIVKISETELSIETHWSTLLVGGLDQPQRWEGVGYDRFVIDERCDVKPEAVTTSILPALADRRGSLWQIGVPKRTGVGKATFYDHFDKIKSGEIEDGLALEWESAEIMDADELDKLKSQMTEEDFDEQFRAKRIEIGGQVYYAFDGREGGNVRPCKYHEDKQIIVGMDFNVDPMCWVLGHDHDGIFEVFDTLYKRNTHTTDCLDRLAAKYAEHRGGWLFYGDASSSARKTPSPTTDLKIIKNDNRFSPKRVLFPSRNPAIEDRINATNAMFCNAKGVRRAFIDSKQVRLIADVKNRSRKEGLRELDDGKFEGHFSDAFDYIMYGRYPVRINVRQGSQGVVLVP